MEKRLFLFTQCKESGFSKFLFVESGIREIFASGMRNPGLWNPEYSSRNPESPKDRIPESKTVLVPLHSALLSFQDKIYMKRLVDSKLNLLCRGNLMMMQPETLCSGEANKPKEGSNAKTERRVCWQA